METSTQAAALTEETPKDEFGQFWNALPDKAAFGVLLAAWVVLFVCFGCATTIPGHSASLFGWIREKWDDSQYDAQHGYLIPVAVLALLWRSRRQLVDSVRAPWWPGILGLGLALLLHTVGYLVQQPRLSMVSFFGGIWLLVGIVWGPRALRVSFFPFFVFAFGVPLGGTFAQGLTLPLRMLAVNVTYFVTHGLLDVPLIKQGTQLWDPDGAFNIEVAAACSGIRGLLALSAITTILAAVTLKTLWKRVSLVALTIPLALLCNFLRLSTIILADKAYKNPAAGVFVDNYFGYVTNAIGIVCVLWVASLLEDKSRPVS